MTYGEASMLAVPKYKISKGTGTAQTRSKHRSAKSLSSSVEHMESAVSMEPYYLDPVNKAFWNAAAVLPPPEQLGYVAARAQIEELQKSEPADDIAVRQFEIPWKEGSAKVSIFRPKSSVGGEPCRMVYYTHGGGWILGSPTVYAPLLEDIVRQTGAAVVFPYYTPAPEKQYPYQFNETYAILEHVVGNDAKYNLQTDSLVLAGDSVGGHFVLVLMQMALQHKLPAKILDLIIFNPVTDTHKKTTSYKTFKTGPFLTEASLDWMIDAFLPKKADRENALTSPLTFASDDVLRQFPRTIIILSDMDPLIDEGRDFADRLQKVGVDAAVIRAVGQLHAFFLLKPTRQSPTARMIVEMITSRIQKGFASSVKA